MYFRSQRKYQGDVSRLEKKALEKLREAMNSTSRDVLALFQKLSYDSSIRRRKLPLPRWSLTGRQGSLFLPNETKQKIR